MLAFFSSLLGGAREEQPLFVDPRIAEGQYKFSRYTPLVDKMVALEEFFRMAMFPSSQENHLKKFLSRSKKYSTLMDELSNIFKTHFDTVDFSHRRQRARPEFDVFIDAFNLMKQTEGYSMLSYLKENLSFAGAVEATIDDLEAVYNAFKASQHVATRAPGRRGEIKPPAEGLTGPGQYSQCLMHSQSLKVTGSKRKRAENQTEEMEQKDVKKSRKTSK